MEDLKQAYKPVNAAESTLVEEIAQNFWRLQRARFLESEHFLMLSGGADPVIPFTCEPEKFNQLRRYMTSIERAYHRAMDQLARMQATRKKEESVKAEPAIGFASQPPATPQRVEPPPAETLCKTTELQPQRATIKLEPSPIPAATS
jgi:hypothetical protein